MLNGIVITIVGMTTVFVFLGVMVASMAALRGFVSRFLRDHHDGDDLAVIAAAVAAARHADRRKGT